MTGSEIIAAGQRMPALAEDDLLAAFADFLRLDVAQGDASPETLRTYWGQVRQYLTWCAAEGVHPALATEDDLKAYRAHLVGRYARSTVATKLAAVRRLYDAAQARGYRPDNPAAGLHAPADRTARGERVKWLPLLALQRLLEAPSPHTLRGKRDRAILALMALHGLRVAEVAGLRIGDLDLEAGTLAVTGKGRKARSVLLVERTAGLLRAWLEVRGAVARADCAALFVSLHHPDAGTPMDRRAIRYLVDGYLARLGLKREGVSCHALRHSFATLSRAAGARLDAISRALGHSSVTTTQVYADIVDAAAENPARFLVGALAEMGGATASE